MTNLKNQLYEACLQFVDNRIETAQKAMNAAQEAANEESKSSAGDKYETTRAMMQIERDRHAAQLAEALKLRQELAEISLLQQTEMVQAGSLVYTNQGVFFIAVSAGKIMLEGVTYFAVSPVSPIGSLLLRRTTGESVELNNRTILIRDVR
jgi:hypothetical protein